MNELHKSKRAIGGIGHLGNGVNKALRGTAKSVGKVTKLGDESVKKVGGLGKTVGNFFGMKGRHKRRR